MLGLHDGQDVLKQSKAGHCLHRELKSWESACEMIHRKNAKSLQSQIAQVLTNPANYVVRECLLKMEIKCVSTQHESLKIKIKKHKLFIHFWLNCQAREVINVYFNVNSEIN